MPVVPVPAGGVVPVPVPEVPVDPVEAPGVPAITPLFPS